MVSNISTEDIAMDTGGIFAGIDPAMIPLGFFFGICSIIGVAGNLIMVLVSVRTKRLRSSCHILIALNCFMDGIHETGQFPFVYAVFSNTKWPQYTCYYVLFGPLIGACSGTPLILAMGIDRLLAIAFPGKYRILQEEPLKYMIIQLILPIGYTAWLMTLGFIYKIDAEFTCAVPVGLLGTPFEMYTKTGFIIYGAIIFVYAAAAYMLHRTGGGKRFKAVFVSMAITVSLVVFGWVFTMITNFISYYVTEDEGFRQLMQQYAGMTVNASLAANFFVYYFKNREYREAIKQMFGVGASSSKLEMSHSGTTMMVKPSVPQKRSASLPAHFMHRGSMAVSTVASIN